jgi:hypothetical protein
VFDAGHAVGVDHMMEAVIAFAAVNENMIISNDTARVSEIAALYREMGWETTIAGRFADSEFHWHETNRLAYPEFDDIQKLLNEGYVITPLLNIESSGNLSANPNVEIGHFINIIETMETRNGVEIVRVYNSISHREEVYTWQRLADAWEHGGGNSPGQAILAKPLSTDT